MAKWRFDTKLSRRFCYRLKWKMFKKIDPARTLYVYPGTPLYVVGRVEWIVRDECNKVVRVVT